MSLFWHEPYFAWTFWNVHVKGIKVKVVLLSQKPQKQPPKVSYEKRCS